jgi:hypothetical protein
MNMGQLQLAQLQAQLQGGAVQQGLSQQALNAPYNQYLQQLQYPQTMIGLQSKVLQGMPIQSQNVYGAAPSPFQQGAGAISGIGSLIGNIGQLPGMAGLGNSISNWWNTPTSPVGDINPATGGTWATDLNAGLIPM